MVFHGANGVAGRQRYRIVLAHKLSIMPRWDIHNHILASSPVFKTEILLIVQNKTPRAVANQSHDDIRPISITTATHSSGYIRQNRFGDIHHNSLTFQCFPILGNRSW